MPRLPVMLRNARAGWRRQEANLVDDVVLERGVLAGAVLRVNFHDGVEGVLLALARNLLRVEEGARTGGGGSVRLITPFDRSSVIARRRATQARHYGEVA